MSRGRCLSWWASLLLCLPLFVAPISAGLRAQSPDAVGDAEIAEAPSESSAIGGRLEEVLEGGVPRTLEDLQAMEDLTRQLLKKLTPCTVGLRIGQAQGSGVLISDDGYILTAAHVIQRPDLPADVILHDGRVVRGRTLGLNRSTDAGLVKIVTPAGDNSAGDPDSDDPDSDDPDSDDPDSDDSDSDDSDSDGEQAGWPHLDMGQSDQLRPGAWCLVLGHPGGYQPGRKPVLRLGRVLSMEDGLIVTDCTLVGGDSGGPLLDMHGRVIGIHSRIGGPLTANMHVPVDTYRDSWDRLARGDMWGEVPRGAPYIGVQGDADAKHARIIAVEPGQPADQAGLKVGDVVTRFNDRDIPNFAALAALVADAEPGDTVELQVQRGEETLTLEMTIGRRR